MKSTKCNIIKDLLPNYIEGITAAETAEMVETHLKECEWCTRMHNYIKKDIDTKVDFERKCINAIGMWYLICPLLALFMLRSNFQNALYLYEGALVLYSAVGLISQLFSGRSKSDTAVWKAKGNGEKRRWIGDPARYYNPIFMCVPSIFTLLVLEGPRILMSVLSVF